ncbi:hypothetical protein, partial [Brucella ovis]|uniref:hypothetical protein n=1 Tax=Brucella ovis TaxID=236 RepID=UPI001AEBF4E0
MNEKGSASLLEMLEHYSCILRDAGLQRAIYLRSGAHVPLSTLRSGTRKSLFSPRPDEFATVALL